MKHIIDDIYDTFETLETKEERLTFVNDAAYRLFEQGFSQPVVATIVEDLGNRGNLITWH